MRRIKPDVAAGWFGCLSPDGRLLAHPAEGGMAVRLIDTDTGKEVRRTEGEACWPAFIAFSMDGGRLTASSMDGSVRVWDTATGKLRHRVAVPPRRFQRVALSQGGKFLAVSGWEEHEVRLYDVASGKPLHAFGGHQSGPLTVAFAPDGKTVATVNREASHNQPVRQWAPWLLRRWDAVSGKELSATREDPGGQVYFNVFSPDGRRLASVTHDGTLRLWDVAAGKELRRWKVPVLYTRFISDRKVVHKSPYPPNPPVFSSDGKVLFTTVEQTLYRWNVDTGKELPPVKTNYPRCIATAGPRMVLLTAWDPDKSSLALLDLDTGKVVRQFAAGRSHLQAVGVSPDGRTFAFQNGKDIRLLETETGRERGKFTGGADFVGAITFSPDGRFLAAAGYRDNAIRVWQLPSGEPARKLEGMERVDSLAFSPYSRRLASGGYANTALVWDVAGLFGPAPPAAKLTPRDLESLWDALAGADAAGAYRAVWKLAESPAQSVPFLKERLKAQPTPDPRRIARLIADLDSNRFKVRQQATEELERLGPRAASALRKALQGDPTPETWMRLRRLLELLEKPGASALPSTEVIGLHVLEALELAGTAEAKRAFQDLASGSPEARLTQEAKAALRRLPRR